MVNLDEAIVARLETHGETFEILLDPKVTDMMKAGRELDLSEYMAVEEVFNNARKGTRPSEEKVREAFGTDDIAAIARRILDKGEVQITAEQRREMLEAKRNRIITYIAANAINPQTKTPHPPKRIELALDEAKFHVDPFKPFDKEIDEAMHLLRPLLPIRFEKSRIAIKLPGDAYGKCYDELVRYGTVEREEWAPDGSWIGLMEIPAGLTTELAEKLKQKTKGSASVKLIN
ncbi:MAG: ribosome assembly factor SBDS [Candidatus Methanomethylophilaceae archaeon]|jgi:ribosome maturation protein SDO1|nr:ribosome assembly factor SBDS [Candidatus Methanomethylophilaceae archaeon]NLF34109.1 ribosome assembly factor SBDS [Thermoplasmatales archaeon]